MLEATLRIEKSLANLTKNQESLEWVVETVKRTAAHQKRSCGYAPHIQMLINSKVGTGTYLLESEHLPLRPDFEDNEVVMDASHPTSVETQEKAAKAKAAKAASAQMHQL